ncbi:MAG TPA: protein phosphatase 2C domain-containing protein [Ktedonobacterales bacterium]|nr:protein phosphatase 2C domain-containing protein [Ktedonobacterales bacterium]
MDTQDPQHTPDDETVSPELAAATDTPSGVAADEAEGSAAPVAPAAADIHATASDAASVPSANEVGVNDEGAALPDTAKLPAASVSAGADAGATAGEETPGAPLTEGALIGEYRIVGSSASEDGPVFYAEPQEPPANADEVAPGLRYVVRELPNGASDQLAHIVAMGLRHPVLLTPLALARKDGRLYLISMEIANENGQLVPPMSQGERLRPVDALRAGIELADALATLHRNNLAHLHISPERVTLYDGRIYLSGVEDATTAGEEDEARPLFARDANYLARTMGMIGGVLDTPALDEESSAQRSLREIALRGEAGTFTRAEELAESFALTLQALASAGAELGADMRSVRLVVTAEAATTVGLVRSANQDAYGVAFFNIHDDAAADAPVGVFLVADGMGGEAHGEIASRLVARAVTAEMTRQFTIPTTSWPSQTVYDPEGSVTNAPRVTLAQALEAAVKEANRQTRQFGQRLNATTGSTVTALAISGARAAIAHLGDSRAYLLREGQLLQLTEDHSLLARMEAVKHPLLDDPSFMVPRSVLYRSVGQEDDVTPDLMEFVVAPGDRVLLCSDGLWDELTPEVIGQALAAGASPRSCASELVALANASGGNDNSTAVVIFFEAEPDDNALLHRAAAPWATTGEGTEDTGESNSNGATSEAEAKAETPEEAAAEPPAAAE